MFQALSCFFVLRVSKSWSGDWGCSNPSSFWAYVVTFYFQTAVDTLLMKLTTTIHDSAYAVVAEYVKVSYRYISCWRLRMKEVGSLVPWLSPRPDEKWKRYFLSGRGEGLGTRLAYARVCYYLKSLALDGRCCVTGGCSAVKDALHEPLQGNTI